jgi:hypothetical protein
MSSEQVDEFAHQQSCPFEKSQRNPRNDQGNRIYEGDRFGYGTRIVHDDCRECECEQFEQGNDIFR